MPEDETELSNALQLLSDRLRVNRERGLSQLRALLSRSEKQELWSIAVDNLKQLILSEKWENRHGGLMGAKIILSHFREGSFAEELQELAVSYLEDKDPLVRLAAGECLGALAKERGPDVYLSSKTRVFKSIEDHLDTSCVLEDEGLSGATVTSTTHKQNTAGGQKIQETSLRALQHLIEGCGDNFSSDGDPLVLRLILKTLQDRNHSVREAGFSVLSSFCGLCNTETLKQHGPEIAESLSQGLSDRWSQVRYEASIAVRMFFTRTQAFHAEFLPILLPAMCLNRYYGAEGVRLYSQETWKTVLGTGGRQKVGEHVDRVVSYYLQQAQAANPLIREATCFCVSELVAKLDHQVLIPYVQSLLTALISSSEDPSFSVRDAACTATGRVISEFPDEAKSYLPQLYELWTAHLADNVISVRENSAFALGSAMRTYKDDAVEKVIEILQKNLPKAKEQPSDVESQRSARNCHPNMYPAAVAVSVRCHSSQEICIACRHATHGELWEASEGAIYLLRELTNAAPERAVAFLPLLSELCYCTNFRKYPYLLETLYRLLPSMAENLGKRRFKPFLDLFIEPLFQALSCGQKVAEAASGYCVSKLLVFVGPNIFKAKLSDSQASILATSPHFKLS